jgi:hypothetical protein
MQSQRNKPHAPSSLASAQVTWIDGLFIDAHIVHQILPGTQILPDLPAAVNSSITTRTDITARKGWACLKRNLGSPNS